MRTGPALLLLGSAVAYQGLAGDLYRLQDVAPDFVFLALLYLSFFAEAPALLFLSLAVALFVDLVSLDSLGTRVCGYLPVVALVNRFRRGFIVESPLLRFVVTLLAAFLSSALQGLYLGWREGRWLGAGFEAKSAFATATLSLVLFWLLDCHRGALGWARDRFFAQRG